MLFRLLCMSVLVYMHIFIFCVCFCVHVCTHVCLCIRIYVCAYINIYLNMYKCICVLPYLCIIDIWIYSKLYSKTNIMNFYMLNYNMNVLYIFQYLHNFFFFILILFSQFFYCILLRPFNCLTSFFSATFSVIGLLILF